MRKIFISLLTAITIVNADFIGFSMGAGLWQQQIGGYVKSGDDINYFNKEDGDSNTGNLKLKDKTHPYVWLKVIHPVPLLPNVTAKYTQYHTTGKNGNVVGTLEIFGQKVKGNGTVDTDLTINSYDITLFYELKFLFEVEAGLGVNVLDGKTELRGSVNSSATWIVPIPYLYARVETPKIMGISIEGEGKFLDVGDAFYHDYQAGVKYHIGTPLIDLSITGGYKYQEIYGEDGDNETDMKFEGAYVEVGARW